MSKSSWFRPADTVLRVPYTPGGALASAVREVVEEEGMRLGLKVKVQEGAGLPLRRSLVTTDLRAGEPCPQGDCPLCLTGEGSGGLHQHRSGVVYQGVCCVCGEGVANYWGESGDSGYCRTLQHQAAIRNKDESNAFAKHLMIHHPMEEGNQAAFKFNLVETHSKPLPRLVSESCFIHKTEANIPMNSKAEWHQPMVARVVVTRELDDQEQAVGGRRGGRGGGRGRGTTRLRRGGA